MSYQVLARRWRPQKFADVVGQEHITRTLQNAIAQERLAHGFLFTGPRGVGKTSTARILARAINCERAGEIRPVEPCNECETCRALLEDRELDVLRSTVHRTTKSKTSVGLRTLHDLAPLRDKESLYHRRSSHANDCGLQCVFEDIGRTPSHVIFILATTDVHKVPATIRSRVQRFDFRPLSTTEIAKHLGIIAEVEGWKAEPEALFNLRELQKVHLRDAEGLLDQVVAYCADSITLEETRKVLGTLSLVVLERATQLVANQDINGLPEFFDLLARQGTEYSLLLRELQSYWTDAVFLLQGLTVPGRSQEECAALKSSIGELNVEDMFRLIRLAATLEDEIKWSVSPRTRFEIAMLRWVTLDRAVSIKDLIEQLKTGQVAIPTAPRPASQAAPQTQPAPQAPIAKAAPTRPAPVATKPDPVSSAPAPVVPARTSPLEVAELNSVWNAICDALEKISSAAAAFAHNDWEVVTLIGPALTVRPKLPGKFHMESLKTHSPTLEQAILQVTGAKVKVTAVAAAEVSVSKDTKQAAAPKIEESNGGTTPGDLFSSVMSQFGGEDVTTKMDKPGK